ncbi:MAG TPA: hypothetical protein VK470_18535, partial [Bacteroidota bacterium]|nr:hypothetical protein [Bacteroidota bacterium]
SFAGSTLTGGSLAGGSLTGGSLGGGLLDAGAAADVIILDYQPPTPIDAENCAGHFLFGMRASMVESVIVGGKWVMKNRIIAGIDTAQVHERSRKAAEQLWERIRYMP